MKLDYYASIMMILVYIYILTVEFLDFLGFHFFRDMDILPYQRFSYMAMTLGLMVFLIGIILKAPKEVKKTLGILFGGGFLVCLAGWLIPQDIILRNAAHVIALVGALYVFFSLKKERSVEGK